MSTSNLYQAWLGAKTAERDAVERRRKIEDELMEALDLPEGESAVSFTAGAYKVKINRRYNRKVDADRLEAIAVENGLEDQMGHLFRFKPEINLAAWRACDDSIKSAFSDAITTTPGRASFQITVEND